MPLVIASNGEVSYVSSEEALAEILGHSNFDGEPWAIGDRLIFEEGTESRIQQVPGDVFYDWPDPVAADLEEVKRAVGATRPQSWQELFSQFATAPKATGCAAAVIIFALAAVASTAV